MTRSPSFRYGFVDRFSGFGFLPPDYPSYRVLTLTLAGLLPAECTSLRWTHLHAGLSRRTVGDFATTTAQFPCTEGMLPKPKNERRGVSSPVRRVAPFATLGRT